MTVSNVLKDLVETLEDGREGFAQGAQKLADIGRTELSATFHRLSQQRAEFSAELRELARQRGVDIDEEGSMAAALHRGWMSLKDAIAGDDPEGVLDAAEQGEDHAVSEFDSALEDDELTPQVREVVERQRKDIKAAHDQVRAARDVHTS